MEEEIQKTALRLPRDPHTQVLEAAKSSGRSMNAEIVARLQDSFTDHYEDHEELISAAEARARSLKARLSIPSKVKARVVQEINRAVRMGHVYTSVDLGDLELISLPDDDLAALTQTFCEWLDELGYGYDWSDVGSIYIYFDAPETP